MKKFSIILLFISVLLNGTSVFAQGVRTLIDVGKSQGEMAKQLNQETSVYNRVKTAVENGRIQIGHSADEIGSRYGEPVVKISSDKTERWVYKPGDRSYFAGVKIYLFFDRSGKLVEIKNLR